MEAPEVPVVVKLVIVSASAVTVTSPVPPVGDIDILVPAIIFVTPPNVPIDADVILP